MSSGGSSDSASMSMTTMDVVFFTSTSTPLYSSAWEPKSTGAYAGTCIFLIVLAVIFRSLLAGKRILEHRWRDKELNRRYVSVRGLPTEAERINADGEGKNATLVSERGVEEHVRVVRRHKRSVTPWRFGVDLPRAAYVTVIAGVGYLLYVPRMHLSTPENIRGVAINHRSRMLAVMTLNVGYFLSVLGGTFLGELAVGRFAELDEH